MVKIKDIGLSADLQDYCHHYFLKEPPLLQALRQQTQTMPEGHMQITPLQGQFLGFLTKVLRPKKILEIGTYTGYSTLIMALNLLPEGKILTCDKNKEWTKIAQKYWDLSGVNSKIELRLAPATDTLAALMGQNQLFDFIFIDADKKNYLTYYEQGLHLLHPDGVMAIDNVLWGGKVGQPLTIADETTKDIAALNKKIAHDERVEICLIPVGDGLSLIHWKK